MSFQLEAVDGPSAGRTIPIQRGRPRVFKVMRHGHEAGDVTVELHEGACLVTNRSERPVLVNGQACNRCQVVPGDLLEIGRDHFRVALVGSGPRVVSAGPPGRTAEPAAPAPTAARPLPSDDSSGSSSGYQPTADHSGLDGVDVTEPAPDGRNQDSDRQRRRRAISASMHSIVDQPRPGLLNRMSSVFSAKARSDRSREEELQRERQGLLEEAGRQVLAGHALGLPEHALSELIDGRAVTIRPDQLARAALDRWQELVRRVSLLDAEIAALRKTLGLGPDLGAVRLTAPTGRGELRRQEERTFAALDAMRTQEMAADPRLPPAGVAAPAPAATAVSSGREPAAAVSGRSRAGGRRR